MFLKLTHKDGTSIFINFNFVASMYQVSSYDDGTYTKIFEVGGSIGEDETYWEVQETPEEILERL